MTLSMTVHGPDEFADVRNEHFHDKSDVWVIADNCDDDTAQQAEAAGARVIVRKDAQLRGKGLALGGRPPAPAAGASGKRAPASSRAKGAPRPNIALPRLRGRVVEGALPSRKQPAKRLAPSHGSTGRWSAVHYRAYLPVRADPVSQPAEPRRPGELAHRVPVALQRGTGDRRLPAPRRPRTASAQGHRAQAQYLAICHALGLDTQPGGIKNWPTHERNPKNHHFIVPHGHSCEHKASDRTLFFRTAS